MAGTIIQRVFSAGELAPVRYARADEPLYLRGLRTCKNFFVRKEGGVSNRAGFKYVATAKSGATGLINLFRWSFTAAANSQLIEAGDLYFRFYKNGTRIEVTTASLSAWSALTAYVQGDLVSSGGVGYYCKVAHTNQAPPNATYWYPLPANGSASIYEIPTPYPAGAFNSPGPLKLAQSGAIITITHPGYAPMELQNLDVLGATPKWVLVAVTTAPSINPPSAGLTGTAGAVGALAKRYVITSAKAETYEESIASAVITVSNTLDGTPEAPIVLGWTAVAGTAEYYVYCDPYNNGVFGYIGTATSNSFRDTGFAPDFELTPPLARSLFTSTYNYPELSCFYQQRRIFAYTDNEPAKAWASRTGFRSNFSISSPLQDDDAVTFEHASNDNNVIRHLIPLKRLVMLCETGEWVVRGDESGVVTPFAITLDQEGYSGASRALPTVVGSNIVYVQARGSIVRDLRFSSDIALIDTRDLTVDHFHLFQGKTISRLEVQRTPHSIVWAVRSDGVLLGCTYQPELDAWGWHRHDTQQNATSGVIEDICVVPESTGDVLYLVVRRTINGATVRYIEKMAEREIEEATFNATVFFVDAGVTYNGAPISTMTGLAHLLGQVVAVVADGTVLYDGDPAGAAAATWTVSGAGELPLGGSYSIVHVGLAIRYADLETLPIDVAGSDLRDKEKNIQSVALIVDKTSPGFKVGPDTSNLVPHSKQPWEVSATARMSKRVPVAISAEWDENADPSVVVRQTNPLPITILALMPRVSVGG